jgi:hypothetical protein
MKIYAVYAGFLSVLRQAKPAVVVIVLSLAVAGCGYQFRVEGPGPTIGAAVPASLKPETAPRLQIPNFENRTLEPNLELKYTTYARKEFSAGSGALVVNDYEPADLVLKGQIVSLSLPSLTFNRTATFESRVIVKVLAVVEDLRTGQPVWKQEASAASEFFLTNDLQFNRVLQDRALEQAGQLIAEDLATRFLYHVQRLPPPGASGAQAGSSSSPSKATGRTPPSP